MPQIVARCKIYTFLQNQGETPTCLNQTGGSFLLDFEGRSAKGHGKLVQYYVNHSENLVGAMLYQPLGKFGWYNVI